MTGKRQSEQHALMSDDAGSSRHGGFQESMRLPGVSRFWRCHQDGAGEEEVFRRRCGGGGIRASSPSRAALLVFRGSSGDQC
jgi:hypothetical protein